MATDRFFIAPYDENSGQINNLKPWLIPDNAFSVLSNAYVFRGRVRKRFGSRYVGNNALTSRLRVNIGTTDGAGNFIGNSPASVTPAIGQLFSIGDQVFTVYQLGNPADMHISGIATLATYDTTTGVVTINGADINTIVYYYPALPVMGLLTFEQSDLINDEKIIAFDTRFAYEYNNGWTRLAGEITPGAATWTGNNSQFFWATTYEGVNPQDRIFFVTNFNENEPNFMRIFDGTNWDNFHPAISATDFMTSARILVPFKNRLVALNTWEQTGGGVGGIQYPNRARWSQAFGGPLAVDAWRQDIAGKGSGRDAPTSQAIISCEFIKDRLIVFFEASTWELVYTGNQIDPFVWQQLNDELGVESTFSIVPFDKVTIGVGNTGIHACNGVNVERIDEKIPDTVWDIHNNNEGPYRVYGIRDYYTEMLYWTFPNTQADAAFPYPNKVLVFNYKAGTWAFNDDSITCFGYFQREPDGITWDSTTVTWDDSVSWDSGSLQARFKSVIAGNQEGYTFICDADTPTNAGVLQITNIALVAVVGIGTTVTITCIDHNLLEGDYIYLDGITGSLNITGLNDTIQRVVNPITQNTFTFVVDTTIIAGVYSGGGTIGRVNNIVIETKQYNFYAQQGRNAYVSKIDFMVDATPGGQTQIEFFSSTSTLPLLPDSFGTNSILGTGTLETFPYPSIPYEATASRLWRPVYFQVEGNVVQFRMAMNDEQMRLNETRISPFALHAMLIYATPTTARLQ